MVCSFIKCSTDRALTHISIIQPAIGFIKTKQNKMTNSFFLTGKAGTILPKTKYIVHWTNLSWIQSRKIKNRKNRWCISQTICYMKLFPFEKATLRLENSHFRFENEKGQQKGVPYICWNSCTNMKHCTVHIPFFKILKIANLRMRIVNIYLLIKLLRKWLQRTLIRKIHSF